MGMRYGTLEVICGPMFSGKSTELLRMVALARGLEGKNVVVFKPSFDTRYSENEVVSHDGLKVEATSIMTWPKIGDDVDTVFIDEVQFMEEPHFSGDLIMAVKMLLTLGVNVVACGLDLNWRGDPFPVTASLLAMADKVTKKTARCQACNQVASKSYKKNPEVNSAIVELGDVDLYEPRCNEHWLEVDLRK